MKRFLVKCLLVAGLPLIIWYSYIFTFKFYYMDEEFPYWMQQKDYINSTGDYNEMVVLGDSSAKAAIRPNQIKEYSVVNLSLGGANSPEMYYSLKTYLENYESPKLVICAFNPNYYIIQGGFLERNLYFHYFNGEQIKEVRELAKSLDDPYWNEDGIDIKIAKYFFYSPEMYLSAIYSAKFFGREEFNIASYKTLEEEKGWMLFNTNEGCSDLHPITEYSSFNVNVLIDYYLNKIIELCEENEIQFIIEQTPINSSSFEKVNENVKQQFIEYFEALSAMYPEVIVKKNLVQYDDIYFGDRKHLNQNGSIKYTNYVIEEYGKLLE